MKEINLPPFYVGQKVVAIKDHSQCRFKKGDPFIITAIYQAPCCGIWLVEIGILAVHNYWRCVPCNTGGQKYRSPQAVFNSASFAPIFENFQEISYSEVVKEEKRLVSAN